MQTYSANHLYVLRLPLRYHYEIVSKNNNLYYRYAKRNYARNKYLRIKGKNYYFDSSGKAYTGKKKINKTTYYFEKDGALNHSGLYYDLASDCAILINADTGKVLYAKNENMRHANASTTKIMTCILALENSKMNETVNFSARAAAQEPTKLYARTGEKFYMRDMLYSFCC